MEQTLQKIKRIEAHSCGSVWRNDVSHAIQSGATVQVIDLERNVLGTLTLINNRVRLNGRMISWAKLWEIEHKWSDIVSTQQTKVFNKQSF